MFLKSASFIIIRVSYISYIRRCGMVATSPVWCKLKASWLGNPRLI